MASAPVWSPTSWRELPARHQPDWPDESRAVAAREGLAKLPPLVFAGEARALVAALGEVAEGRAFLAGRPYVRRDEVRTLAVHP